MNLSTTATTVVPAPRERVWDVLVDPDALPDVLRPCFRSPASRGPLARVAADTR